MLKITTRQLDEFRASRLKHFTSRMCLHLKNLLPEDYSSLSDDIARDWVQHGIDRALSYGFVSERDVCRYIILMFALGRNFDNTPWCRDILLTHKADSSARADRLNAIYSITMQRLAQTTEPSEF